MPSTVFPRKLYFIELCINGKLLPTDGNIKTCEILQRNDRGHLAVTLAPDMSLELDVQHSLAKYTYSKWVPGSDTVLIMDFKMTMVSVPPWLLSYSTASSGCAHKIQATMKVQGSQSSYNGFSSSLRSLLTASQCNILENTHALILWKERCVPHSPSAVKSVTLCPPKFQSFSLEDLERLKDDRKWLSDSHVTLILLDWFQDCSRQNIWGNLKIQLLDTFFWAHVSQDPERYGERLMSNLSLLEYDFLLMPMFNSYHWRLGIVENPAGFLQGNTVFHILDSFRNDWPLIVEAKHLQKILLKHFEGEVFKEDRIRTNLAQVPHQPNQKDCGCFMIYFAKKFLSQPDATMTLIKTPFPSVADRMVAWGLKTHDLTFVRREIRTLLFKYVTEGNAIVEYV